MDTATRFVLGETEIISVWDGTLDAQLEGIRQLDPDEARRLVEQDRTATGVDPLVLPVRAFIVRSPHRLVLVDTGSGKTKGPRMGFLKASLERLGISSDRIDAVLFTHLHLDHTGGAIDEDGRPAFPRAELVMHAREAEFFLDTPTERLDSRSVRNVPFLRKVAAAYGGRVRRVENGGGLPGIAARLAPGHTPGHTVWEVASRDSAAFILGDVVHLGAVQLPRPATPMIYDVDPDLAGRTRIAILGEAAERRLVVAGAHLPGEGLGTIKRSGAGFEFERLADVRQG